MQNLRRSATLLALVGLLAPAAIARSQAPSPTPVEPARPAAQAAPPPAEVATKVLRVATSGDYAPFSFATSPEVLEGFDIAVAGEFARERGYKLETVRFRWPDLGAELAAGSFDVAMSGVTVKAERSIAGRYSVPVAASHAVAITWKGSGAGSAAELDHAARRIAVNAGGYLEGVARRVFDHAQVVAIADNEAVRMALLDRAFDAVVTDSFEEKVWTAGMTGVVRIGPLSDDRKAYLLPADRAALAAELDQWLLAKEKDGTLAQLRTRWFAPPAAADASPKDSAAQAATAEPVAALASAILERQALMPMVYDAKRLDGKPIEDKTQEAAVIESAMRATDAAAVAAGKAPPPAEAVRKVFEVLIAMGKDVQQGLADRAARYRPARKAAAPGAADDAAKQPAPDTEPPPETPNAAARPTGRRVYDLATQLRPAIARITEKVARILVALDGPRGAADVRRDLDLLVSQGVQPQRVDVLAAAVAEASVHEAR